MPVIVKTTLLKSWTAVLFINSIYLLSLCGMLYALTVAKRFTAGIVRIKYVANINFFICLLLLYDIQLFVLFVLFRPTVYTNAYWFTISSSVNVINVILLIEMHESVFGLLC